MTRKFILVSGLTASILFSGLTQDTWTLQECIEYALEQSLNVERAQVNEDFAEVDLKQARQSRWPSLNANVSAGLNFGRVINPSTNQFETDDSYFNSYSVGSGVTLFGGNRINNSIKQSGLNLDAATEDLRQTRLDLALDVSLAYLNVLFAQENVTNAEQTLALTREQLIQIDKLIAAGSRPENERYDIVAQVALDERDLVQTMNTVEQNLLALKQLMRLEPGYDLVIVAPELQPELLERFETYTFESIYSAALQTQPRIAAQQIRIESAELGEKVAKGSVLPTLTASGNAVSNWSDLDRRITGTEFIRQPFPLYLNNTLFPYQAEFEVPTGTETKPYFDQVTDNFGFGFGVSLSIPIYNNYRNRAAIDRAKLNTILERNSDEQIRQVLKTDIQNALASARAARESYEASQSALNAAEIAYANSEKRFDLGTLNSYDLINARTRLNSSRVNLTIAKYDYIFRILIIEYYLGRGLQYE